MRPDPEQATALPGYLLRAIREGLIETRRALQELRAKPLKDLGLGLTIPNQTESFISRSALQAKIDIDNDFGDILEV